MRKPIITQAWLAEFYAEGLKPKFKGALKRSALKPTSSQAQRRRKKVHKLRVQASDQSPQAQGSGSQGTSVQAGPGHKLPGQRYFFYV